MSRLHLGEARAREIVRARSGGRCEACRAPATDFAHRRARGQGGGWRPSNALDLCRACHAWTESYPVHAAAGGWRLVHDDTDPTLVPVWIAPALAYAAWWQLTDDGMYDMPAVGHWAPAPVAVPDGARRWAA